MRYQVLMWLCLASLVSACSNNTSATLNAANLEQILAVDKASVNFNSQRNAPLPAPLLVSARFYGDALKVHPVGPLPGWLSMEINENPNQKLTLMQFSINDTRLPAGKYISQIRIIVYRKSAFSHKPIGHKDINIFYHLMDHFDASVKNLEFKDVFGNEHTLNESIQLYGTGSKWRIDTDQKWLHVNRRHGIGNAQIQVSIDLGHKKLKAGRQLAHIKLSDKFSGRNINIPVTLVLEPPRLLVSEDGIAFTQLYRKRNVERKIRISANSQKPIPWSAYSNRSWLKVEQSKNGKYLSMKANPKGLKVGMHYSTITVRPKLPAKNVERIRVGFYINGNVRKPKPKIQLGQSQKTSDMVSDPIRPLVYVTAGSNIHQYNIYTSEKQIIEDLGKDLAGLTVSSDGRYLYMADIADYSIRVYDLTNEELAQIWHGPFFDTNAPRPQLHLSYARLNGFPVLLNNSFYAFNAKNGNVLARYKAVTKPGQECCKDNLPFIANSRNGSSLYLLERAEHNHELYRFALDYSYVKGVGLSIEQTGYMVEGGLALDLAVSPDGAEVCTVSTGTNVFQCYYGAAVTPSRSLKLSSQPNNIEFGGVGDIYAASGATGKKPVIWRFNAQTGKRNQRYRLAGEINERQMVLSSDDLSIITLSNQNQTISFLSTR